MANPNDDQSGWIPWISSHDATALGPNENQNKWLDSDEFEGEQLELILSDSDDMTDPPAPKEKKGKQKENVKLGPARATTSTSMQLPSHDNMTRHVLGRLAPKHQMFCPMNAVSKYPYKYMKKVDSEAVSQTYFVNGQFRARGWTLYYIHTLLVPPTKPLILLLAAEVEAFLSEINEKLDLELNFPHSQEEPGFLLKFHQDRSPRPRYLGRLTAENTLEMLEDRIPGPAFKEPGEADDLDPRSLEAFRLKIEAAIQAGKNKSKASKEKKKKARIIEKKGCCAQLKRTQCYLGMRPRWKALTDPHNIPDLTWSELQEAIKKHESAKTKSQRPIDTNKPAPHDLYQSVVFISVDVESYERHHKTVTEIGISTLDTRDILQVAPGKGGEAWMNKIRSRHFRIKENSHLKNTDFINGCADKFEKDFGTSEWISIKEAPQTIASCFRPPYSGPNLINDSSSVPQMQEIRQDATPDGLSSSQLPAHHEHSPPERKIILVGHDIKTDIDYLLNIGYDVNNLSNVLEVIDTIDLFRAMSHEQQGRNLGSVLLDLGRTGWNLHNAGNDAAYTLQAMIGIAFKALDIKRDRRATLAAVRASRANEAANDAKERVAEDFDEWDLADEDEGDGGIPIPKSKQDNAWVTSKPAKGSSNIINAEQLTKEQLEAKAKDDEEAERLAAAVGEDIGEEEKGGFEVPVNEVNVSEVRDSVLNWRGIEASPNYGSPVSLGIHSDMEQHLLEQGQLSSPEGVNTNTSDESPIPTHMLERLAFLDSLDAEDGGVKL